MDAISRPAPVSVTLDLPMPPSVNRLWRKGRRGCGMYLSPAYQRWQKLADSTVVANGTWRTVKTWFPKEFAADIGLQSSRGDIDNRAKAVLDWAQSRSLVANDKYCTGLWVHVVGPEEAPEGCRLILTEGTHNG